MSGAKRPPGPPSKSRIGLTEVERAISVLDGRHPDHEKVQRKTREAIEQRRGQLRIEMAKNARARRFRVFAFGVGLAAAGAAGLGAWRVASRTRALEAALETAEAPWLARGFARVTSNALTAAHALQVGLSGAGCFVALATVDGPLRTTAEGASVEASRSVAWCTCGPGQVHLDAPASSALVGLAVLRIDASALGGPLARSWVDFTPGAWIDSGTECAVAMLDGWIDARPPLHTAPDAAWIDADGSRAGLQRAGLRPIAAVDPAHPFGVVDAPAGDCVLAIARASEPLSLRAAGGEQVASNARGALAWCDSAAARWTVWRDGRSPVAVLAGPAARIGGLLGVRETAEASGTLIPTEGTWLGPSDLAWEASAVLRASALSNVESSPLGPQPGHPDRRPVALALARGAVVVATPGSATIACDPPFAPLSAGPLETLCAPAAPVAWLEKSEAAAAAAHGNLPVWLSPLEGRHEPDAIARIPQLLALTRHLGREGFEATSLEGVTELLDGVRVVGRAGEDAIVAVGLGPEAPWAFPYSNGPAWDLGDTPLVVPLQPGEAVKLVASPRSTAPLSSRRTVVYRRSSSASAGP